MNFVDKEIKCVDCGAVFLFSAAEQLFFRSAFWVKRTDVDPIPQ